jgi:hypothetical protein
MSRLNKKQIDKLLRALNEELGKMDVNSELYLVGGAVMCLAFTARPSTQDIDAIFVPSAEVRAAAKRVALQLGVKEDWLNDGVKGFLSQKGEFEPYLELSHLQVFVAKAEYLLAMKCLAMRIGEEFRDIEDVRYLLRHLDIETYSKALEVIGKYYPSDKFPTKARYVLQELLQCNGRENLDTI